MSAATQALLSSTSVPWSVRRCLRSLLHLRYGSLDVVLPDQRVARFFGKEAGPQARIEIQSYCFVKRLAAGDVGFAEGYSAGEWTSDDLVSLLRLLAANQKVIDHFAANPIWRAAQMVRHWFNRNSRAGARRNIHAHYDLGNAFYRQWLDPSMTYSSGLEVRGDLAAAQERKYAEIARAAGLEAHHHVLEIGCGWGGFAEYAARSIGCRVTALTISEQQFAFARERIKAAGLADQVEIKFCDYRDATGVYDRIVSIEMFEAVGQRFWKQYFETLYARLRTGGQAALQVITIREDIFPRYQREMDFIRQVIFPGGMLPTPTHLIDLGRQQTFELTHYQAFGQDYARTCQLWREKFDITWQQIAQLGFDEKFRRVWRYYLAYCEAGFAEGTVDVCHIAFSKP